MTIFCVFQVWLRNIHIIIIILLIFVPLKLWIAFESIYVRFYKLDKIRAKHCTPLLLALTVPCDLSVHQDLPTYFLLLLHFTERSPHQQMTKLFSFTLTLQGKNFKESLRVGKKHCSLRKQAHTLNFYILTNGAKHTEHDLFMQRISRTAEQKQEVHTSFHIIHSIKHDSTVNFIIQLFPGLTREINLWQLLFTISRQLARNIQSEVAQSTS